MNWKDASNLYWKGGRLTLVSLEGTNANEVSFSYNSAGIRTKKHFAGGAGMVPYYTDVYTVDGSRILSEVRTDDQLYTVVRTLYYIYDASGSVIGMEYNGAKYWYDKNLQGDIVGIRNSTGTLVAQYVYDAWGNHRQITDGSCNDVSADTSHIANINPFRYRGYYYDVETGWYYLNARYYDPNVGRFLSPDDTDLLLLSPRALTDKNLYAYCDNNPVMRVDSNGEWWHIAIGGLIGGFIGGLTQVASNLIEGNNAFDGVGSAFLSGAASGALASTGVGVVGSIVGNAGISMVENAATQVVENKGFDNFDIEDMLIDGTIGGISGAIGGGGTGSKHLNGLGKQTLKRTINTTVHKGIKQGVKEFGKALTYYAKSTRSYYIALKSGVWKDLTITTASVIASSDFMKYQYKKITSR